MNRALTALLIIFATSINAKSLSKLDFCKKWNFQGYIYYGMTFSPEENEKNDYLQFYEDGTFESIDEGENGKGTWEWMPKNKSLYLYNSKSNKPLILEVIKLTETTLIVLLKDEKESIKLKFSKVSLSNFH